MKKYILTMLVLGTFGFYALYLKVGDSSTITVQNTQTALPVDTLSQNTSSNTPPPDTISNPVTVTTPTPVTTVSGEYKDGNYAGVSADAYYGNIQVKAIIQGGKLVDVQFLDYPQDRGTSVRINNHAMPILRSEAIHAQSANVNTVSGASDSSGAFRQSLASALSQAKNS